MSTHLLAAGSGWRQLLSWAATLAAALVIGAALGLLSWHFWVVGLFAVVVGVTIGWVRAVLGLWLGLRPSALAGALALVVAWSTVQGFDDAHHLRAHRLSFAEANATSALADLPPEARARILAAGGVDFLAADADRRLEAEAEARIGFEGPLARWMLRAQDNGLRLAGGFRSGRGLPVGALGVTVAHVLELAAAFLIVRRIGRRAAAAHDPSLSR